MKRIFLILVSVGGMLGMIAAPAASLCYNTCPSSVDSTSVSPFREGNKEVKRKMSHSAYPVQMHVVGSSVRVESPKSQILPIYTHNGTFYLIMRLNKGTNWLNGLPKGRYFINNRLVIIK